MELNDVLSDKEPEAPQEAPQEVKEEVQVEKPQSIRAKHKAKEDEARGRDPVTGKYTPKEAPKEEPKVEAKEEVKTEPKVEPKKEEFTEKERAFLRGLEEERRKRQDLERQLNEIRNAKQQPEGEKKTFWDDPEGTLKRFEQGLDQKLTQRELDTRLSTSEYIARSKYQDFDQKVQIFAELLQSTPGLHAQWLASPDPAEFVYRTAEKTQLLRDAGGLEQLRAKIEKETREKLESEYKKKEQELEKKRSALTGSLSETKGASTRQEPVYTGPTPLNDILR